MQMSHFLWRARAIAAAGLALAAAVVSPLAGGSSPADGAPLAQRPVFESTGTGILAGRVIDAASGAPVANTLMGLSQRIASGPNTTPSAVSIPLVLVMADGQGRFVVRDVPKGSFLLLATAPGYIVSSYGQGRAAGPTHTIDLVDGEVRTDLVIRLWRHAVISGKVTDEAGEPVVGATVRVLRRNGRAPGGEIRYQAGMQAVTDDRGLYRLTSLVPGDLIVTVPQTQVTVPAAVVDNYLQSAAGRGGSGAGSRLLDQMNSGSAVPSAGGGVRVDDLLLQSSGTGRLVTIPPPAGGALFVYPTLVYPASDGVTQTAISVGPGEERSGVDFRLSPVRSVRISGTVVADGAPAPNVGLRLMRTGGPPVANDADFEAAASVTAADGTFTLLGVPPGQYVLKALRTPRVTLAPGLAANPAIAAAYGGTGAPAGPAPPLIGVQMPIAVGSANIQDLTVSLRPGASMSGRVVFESAGNPPTAQQIQAMGVLLTSEDGGFANNGLQIFRVGADAAFKGTATAPGRYSATALAIPAGWHYSGTLVGGKPLASAIDLSGDDVGDVTLTYTNKIAQIGGTVRTPAGVPRPGADVVVFPTDRTRWTQEALNPRSPRVEQASPEGVFQVASLLPGEYFVAAVDDGDVPEFVDAAFLETVSRFALRVTLAAGDKASRDLGVGRIK